MGTGRSVGRGRPKIREENKRARERQRERERERERETPKTTAKCRCVRGARLMQAWFSLAKAGEDGQAQTVIRSVVK